MGAIDLYNGSSLCMVKSSNGFRFSSSLKTKTCDFSRNQRKLNCMASISATVKEGRQQLTGDSFIRHHLRELSPYQSILPFEVIIYHLIQLALQLTMHDFVFDLPFYQFNLTLPLIVDIILVVQFSFLWEPILLTTKDKTKLTHFYIYGLKSVPPVSRLLSYKSEAYDVAFLDI